MSGRTRKLAWAALLAGGLPLFGLVGPIAAQEAAAQPDPDLARKAYQFREKYCYKCHVSDSGAPQFDLLEAEVLLDTKRKPPLVAPGDPDGSKLWQRVGIDRDMPPEDAEQPSDEERDLFKAWILAGAPDYQHERPFVGEQAVLSAIERDLLKVAREDRKHQRYFSLAHLHNNTTVDDFKLRQERAALSKAINSMSRQPVIVVPQVVDGTEGSVFRIDLREVGWDDPAKWLAVLDPYPYGMEWNDPQLRDLHQGILEIFQTAGGIGVGLPYIRADWFVDEATRPPIYHTLLDLPATLPELEKELGVTVERDFNNNRLARAGFAQSGVSRHNRLVDRHVATNARYYYRSYDFGKSFGKGVLFRFPLGPVFTNGAFTNQAFEEDGGEFIWALPNGMQAYYIADKTGKRLDKAPVDIMHNLSEIAGTPEVVNGISCMGCHARGIQTYSDTIRDAFVGQGNARTKVQQLYVPRQKMDSLHVSDTSSFLSALDQAVGPFLREVESEEQDIRDLVKLPEPIMTVAKLYNREIGLEDTARELGLEDPEQFRVLISGNQQLQQSGLGPLSKGERIVREMWDSQEDNGVSLYQKTAQDMGLGTPLTFKQ